MLVSITYTTSMIKTLRTSFASDFFFFFSVVDFLTTLPFSLDSSDVFLGATSPLFSFSGDFFSIVLSPSSESLK